MSDLPPPAAQGHDAHTNNSCSLSTGVHISSNGKNKLPQLSQAAAFLCLADWRCQPLGLTRCRNALAARCQYGTITVVCRQPRASSYEALATSFTWAGCLFPLFVCVFVCLVWSCLLVSTWVCYGAVLPLLWGIFLPCGTGLVTSLNGKTWKQREGRRIEGEDERMREDERRGNPHKDEKESVGGLCKCMCACLLPAACHGYSSISLRFSTFSLP